MANWTKVTIICWWNSSLQSLSDKRFAFLSIPCSPSLCHYCLSQTSGLSTWIGRQMLSLSSLPYWAVTLLACILVSMVTEFVSNPATITIFLPILCSMVSKNNGVLSCCFPISFRELSQGVRVSAVSWWRTWLSAAVVLSGLEALP